MYSQNDDIYNSVFAFIFGAYNVRAPASLCSAEFSVPFVRSLSVCLTVRMFFQRNWIQNALALYGWLSGDFCWWCSWWCLCGEPTNVMVVRWWRWCGAHLNRERTMGQIEREKEKTQMCRQIRCRTKDVFFVVAVACLFNWNTQITKKKQIKKEEENYTNILFPDVLWARAHL